jgi:hypothetical protein
LRLHYFWSFQETLIPKYWWKWCIWQLLAPCSSSQFQALEWVILNLSSTNEMNLTKSSFYSNLKIWKIPKIEYFIAIWCLDLQPRPLDFLNIEWHGKIKHTGMFFTVMFTYGENFRFFGCILYLIWIFFTFFSEIHNNFKPLQKNLKKIWLQKAYQVLFGDLKIK